MKEFLIVLALVSLTFLAISFVTKKRGILFSLIATFIFIFLSANVSYYPQTFVFYDNGTVVEVVKWIKDFDLLKNMFLSLGIISFVWSVAAVLDQITGGRLFGRRETTV